MGEILVLCPTRGRPGAAMETQASFTSTVGQTGTKLVFVVDRDDPQREEYEALALSTLVVEQEPPGNMVKALNAAAGVLLGLKPDLRALGFIGDDHRFRTPHWDRRVEEHLDRGALFVYGDDLAQREGLPTQVFIDARVVKALGWMAPPTFRHLYVDNAWLDLGKNLNAITYDPKIVIEHLHPAYGKAEWTDGHKRVNSAEVYGHDFAAYSAWVSNSLPDDLARIEAAL